MELTTDRLENAQRAYEGYSFGADLQVTDQGNWEYRVPETTLSRAVTVEGPREDDGPAPRWRLTFTVRFDDVGSITEVNAIDSNGGLWGQSTCMKVTHPGAVHQLLPSDLPQIVIGESYKFYAEMQEAEQPAGVRMRNYTGQFVTVKSLADGDDDPEASRFFTVVATDGRTFTAAEEELNGWNKELGQYFWADGTYGPDRSRTYLSNERRTPANV